MTITIPNNTVGHRPGDKTARTGQRRSRWVEIKGGRMDDVKDVTESFPEEIRDDVIIQVFSELMTVRENSRMLVLVAHGFMELLVNSLIDANLKNAKKVVSDSRSYPHSSKLLLLNELDIIDADEYKIFDWFRKLRNKAAHEPIFYVKKQDLCHFSNEEHKDPSKFYNLCIYIIGSFWNRHVSTFAPIFAKAIHQNNIAEKMDSEQGS